MKVARVHPSLGFQLKNREFFTFSGLSKDHLVDTNDTCDRK